MYPVYFSLICPCAVLTQQLKATSNVPASDPIAQTRPDPQRTMSFGVIILAFAFLLPTLVAVPLNQPGSLRDASASPQAGRLYSKAQGQNTLGAVSVRDKLRPAEELLDVGRIPTASENWAACYQCGRHGFHCPGKCANAPCIHRPFDIRCQT